MTRVVRVGNELQVGVRCFAVPHRGGGVIARCVDLDLAVVRPTLDEARSAMEQQVYGYVASVLSRGWVDRLQRPAPLPVLAQYYGVRALCSVQAATHTLRLLANSDIWSVRPAVHAAA